MSRGYRLTLFAVLLAGLLYGGANDQALWHEYGLVDTDTIQHDKTTVTAYRMKDAAGALAAWEWLRSAKAHDCNFAPFCTAEGGKVTIFNANYLLVFDRRNLHKSDVDAVISSLPDRRDSLLPPVLSFLPRTDMVPETARYLLGPASVEAFAPELNGNDLGFQVGTEGQMATYKTADGKQVRLVVLEYPTPDMARKHAATLGKSLGSLVKRSGSLMALVLPPATPEEASGVLAKVEYTGKVVWDDEPLPSPIKPLYELLWSIIQLSAVMAAICTLAGLFYAGMRIYRRRYGNLEDEESLTTLHLSGD